MSSSALAFAGMEPESSGVQLWDFQGQSVSGLRTNIRKAWDAQIASAQVLSAPTGSGKTEIAMYLIQACMKKGNRAIFACDRLALIGQTSRRMDLYGIPHGIIQGQNERRDADAQVQVASIQTLRNRGWPDADIYIIDECHSVYATVMEQITELRARAKASGRKISIIGLTATPFRAGLGTIYDDIVSVTTTNKLIRDGFLAPYRIFNASQPDMDGAKTDRDGEWTKAEATRRSLPIVGDVVAEYLKWCSGQKFIAFGATIKHCEEIRKRFMDVGVNCALYTSKTPDPECEDILREFHSPDGCYTGLVSVAKLAKGFDAPAVTCIIMARPLKRSLSEHIQVWGRGLRADPSNPDKVCTILDHAGNVERFWEQTEHFFQLGAHTLDDGTKKPKKKGEVERKPVKCPKCAALHNPRPACPSCGFEYPRGSKVRELPGELREWTGASAAAPPVDVLRDLAAQLAYVQQESGRKLVWAQHRFRELSGGHTLPYVASPAPPTEALRKRLKYLDIKWAKGQQKRKARR